MFCFQLSGAYMDSRVDFDEMQRPDILKTFLPSQVVEPPTALVSEAFPMVANGKAASKSG